MMLFYRRGWKWSYIICLLQIMSIETNYHAVTKVHKYTKTYNRYIGFKKLLGFSLDTTCNIYTSAINTIPCNTDIKNFSHIKETVDRGWVDEALYQAQV